MEPSEATEEKTMSVAQKRAEIRRRKLLMNSEERMNRIVGCTKNGSENNGKTSLLVFYLKKIFPLVASKTVLAM